MKILFCTSGFITGGGGIASYAHDFLAAFKEGNEFVVVTHDDYQKLAGDDFEVAHFNMNDFSIGNAKRFMDFIVRTSPQLIVNSAFPLLSLVTPYIDDNIKIITVAHFVNGKLLMVAGLNANYADITIAQSTYAKENLKKIYNVSDETNVEVVYNFMPLLPNVDLHNKKTRKILKIVFPGGNSIAKSFDVVCLVLKKLLKTKLEFDFYWIGKTTLPGANWRLTRIKDVGDCINKNDSRIKTFGPVSREEAKRIMADANIFLLPSRGEGCPITLLEAMRGGCIPIISNAKHGSLDIIQNGKNGFVVKQNSVDQIVKCIIDIIERPRAYDYIYDASLNKFTEDLQYKIWVEKMTRLLNSHNKHRQRKEFSKTGFLKNVVYIKIRNSLFWIEARLFYQPYSMIVFRLIKHLYN